MKSIPFLMSFALHGASVALAAQPSAPGPISSAAPAADALPQPSAQAPAGGAENPPSAATPSPVAPAAAPPEPPPPAKAAPTRVARIDVASSAPPPPPPANPGKHLHDGLYVRLGLGFSGLGDTVVSEAQLNDEPRDEGSVSSFATVSELAIGGTLGRGFVLGGGVYSASALASSFERVRGQPIPSELQRPDNFSVVGIMADWYFNPRRGFHAQAALGIATLTGVRADAQRFRDRRAAVGVGAMLGAGYEWWVGEDWGIGILGRLTAGVATETDDNGERWFHLAATTPSILFSATYH